MLLCTRVAGLPAVLHRANMVKLADNCLFQDYFLHQFFTENSMTYALPRFNWKELQFLALRAMPAPVPDSLLTNLMSPL